MTKSFIVGKFRRMMGLFSSKTASMPSRYYFILLCVYIVSNMMFMVGWQGHLSSIVWHTHVVLFSCVMWASAVYLFVILTECTSAWKDTKSIIIIGISVFLITALLSRVMTSDSYAYIIGGFLCITACGKNYKKILHTYLIILVITLVISRILMVFGITFDAVKPNRINGGHSLGILYPNNWGFLVFAVMLLTWYLFLQGKKIITLLIFWSIAAFMYKYITCLTIAGLAFTFPIVSIAIEWLQKKRFVNGRTHQSAAADCCDAEEQEKMPRTSHRFNVGSFFVIGLPYLVFAVMMILCWQMDWLHDNLYDTVFDSMAMRFVEGGYAIRLNGVSLFGHPFEQWDPSVIDYSQEIEMIIDSAYIGYLIIRGVAWMLITLSWIAYAHYLCLKRKDYGLIVISFFFLVFSMMERPGLDVWYNFVLLYPLADYSSWNHNTIVS